MLLSWVAKEVAGAGASAVIASCIASFIKRGLFLFTMFAAALAALTNFVKGHMILGHERQIEYLNRAFGRGKEAHAYLFYGPEHVGKFTLAKELAKTLNCEIQVASDRLLLVSRKNKCECGSCMLIDQDAHPGVVILSVSHTLVSKKEIRKDIPIGDIRELKRRFSYAAAPDEWQIAIIDEAERMNDNAANAFLKLLEEPGPRTLFFLITPSPELLLPTVVSRAVPLRFSLVPDAVLAACLSTRIQNKDEREGMLRLSSGRPGIMLRLLEDEAYRVKEEKFLKSFAAVLKGGAPEIFRFSEKMAADDILRERTGEYLLRWLRALLLGAKPEDTRSLAEKIKRVHEIISIIETSNVNPRLALDVMLLEAVGL